MDCTSGIFQRAALAVLLPNDVIDVIHTQIPTTFARKVADARQVCR